MNIRDSIVSASGAEFSLLQREADCGAVRLCDREPGSVLTVVCESCARCGRYRVESLIRMYGARAGLPDVLRALADRGECRRSELPMMPCGAHYRELRR